MQRYHPSTLFFPRAKGKWYIRVTVPAELVPLYKNKQVARSTGTADYNEARQRQHYLTAQVYADFDRKFTSIWEEKVEQRIGEFARAMHVDPSKKVGLAKLEADAQYVLSNQDAYSPEQVDAAVAFVDVENEDLIDSRMGRKPKDQQLSFLIGQSLNGLTERVKTTKERRKALLEFDSFLKGPSVSRITKQDAYRYAEFLESKGAANSTIKKKIGFVRQCLGWLERQGHIDANPFQNLQLSKYGRATEHYIPFSKQQLYDLFKLDMPEDHRLALTILLTTGMRLDEMALLRFEDVKEEDGIRFFDLRGKDKVIKNIGSARMVPLHDQTKPLIGSGRIFPNWPVNADGKAQGPASKDLMRYIHQIRTDDRQVTHSLRGTLKDLMRDAGVSQEINNFITGHGASDVAGTYGQGPSLAVRHAAINKVEHPWIATR